MDQEAKYWRDKWTEAQKQIDALQKIIEGLIKKASKGYRMRFKPR